MVIVTLAERSEPCIHLEKIKKIELIYAPVLKARGVGVVTC